MMLSLDSAIASLEDGKPPPSLESFQYILHRCRKERLLSHALRLHTYMHRIGLDGHKFFGNYLVSLLADVGCVFQAQQVFNRLIHPNECSLSSLIAGYVECGKPQHSFTLYQKLQESITPSAYTFVALLKASAKLKDVENGRKLHVDIARTTLLEEDRFIGSALIDMYVKCSLLPEAQEVFNNLPFRSLVSWTATISGYVKHGHGEEALKFFEQMQCEGFCPDVVTFIHILKACGITGAIEKGTQIYIDIVKKGLETGLLVGSALVDMYVYCGALLRAQEVFDKLSTRDVVSWTTLIAGYANHDQGEEALNLLEEMQSEEIFPNAVTFVCCLKACASTGAIEKGLDAHVEIARQGLFKKDITIGNTLIDMYAKCCLLDKAKEVFDSLPYRDAISWNALIAGYVNCGHSEESINLFEQMQLEGIAPKSVTFVCILKACSSIGALDKGRAIHDEISKSEQLESDLLINSTLIDMYANCGLIEKAKDLLANLSVRDAISWTALIVGYSKQGHSEEALDCLIQMHREGILPNAVTFTCSLRVCGTIKAIEKGQELHAEISKRGLLDGDDMCNALVDMYAKCGVIPEAKEVFDKLLVRDVVCWNSLIGGCNEEVTLYFFEQMQIEGVCPNGVTFTFIAKACGRGATINAQLIHTKILNIGYLETDYLLSNAVIEMYANCGLLDRAQEFFDKLSEKDVVSWNTLIEGYASHNHGEEALRCFKQMQSEGIPPDAITYIWSLKACGISRAIEMGQEIHEEVRMKGLVKSNLSVCNTLMDMYVKFGLFATVQAVFDNLSGRDVVSWNVLISGFAKHGYDEQALTCFEKMILEDVYPNNVTYNCCLRACGSSGAKEMGQKIHLEISRQNLLERDPELGIALVDMYMKVGLLAKAQEVYTSLLNKSPAKHTGLLNALIAGYVGSGCGEDALEHFDRMQSEGVSTDSITFVHILKACGTIGATMKGSEIHEQVARAGLLDKDLAVGNALIDMYAKCGLMAKAQEVFDQLPHRDIITWTAIISGYAQLGESENAFLIFEIMRGEGQEPNKITFLGVLTACSHDGLVDEGKTYFEVMRNCFCINPTLEHLTCMVDVLSRAGQLEKAIGMIKRMPFQPTSVLWHTLLSACQKWGDMELAKQAFYYVKDAPAFVCMSNIYAYVDMLGEA